MDRADNEDWLVRQTIVVPHACRGDSLWHAMHAEAQRRMGAALRAMYTDTLLQPLSPPLAKLVYQIRTQPETS